MSQLVIEFDDVLWKLTQDLPKGELLEFRSFDFKDKNRLSGRVKKRRISAPNESMTRLHRRLVVLLRELQVKMPYATGAVLGMSFTDNAKRHVEAGSRYYYLTDIKNAYGSVQTRKLAEVLAKLLGVTSTSAGKFLERYCMAPEGGLYVGGPASPDLFNLFAHFRVDLAIAKMCERFGFVYTRYLDDITLSSPSRPIGKKVRQGVRQILKQAGFITHDTKTKLCDLSRGQSIVITGVGVRWEDDKPRTFVPAAYRKAVAGLNFLAQESRVGVAVVEGKIQPVKQILQAEFKRSGKLTEREYRLVRDFLHIKACYKSPPTPRKNRRRRRRLVNVEDF